MVSHDSAGEKNISLDTWRNTCSSAGTRYMTAIASTPFSEPQPICIPRHTKVRFSSFHNYMHGLHAVSYTHLDVYKRQVLV